MRSHSKALVAATLLAVGLATFLLLLVTRESAPIVAGDHTRELIGESGSSPNVKFSSSADASTATARVPAEVTDTSQIVSESVEVTQAEDLARVTVRHAQTREPVPQATLQWWPLPEGGSGQIRIEKWIHDSVLEANVEPLSQAFVTDGEGRALVPRSKLGFLVIASLDSYWGYAISEPGERGSLDVDVGADRDIRVAVKTSTDAPAGGALVALRLEIAGSPGDAEDCLLATASTSDGVATLRHVEHVLRNAFDLPEGYDMIQIASADLVCSARPVRVERDALPSFAELTLESTGACEVRIVDAAGALVTGEADVELILGRSEEESPCVARRLGVTTGSVVFDHVSIGGELEARVWQKGSMLAHVGKGSAPASSGARTSITVTVGADAARVVGRAVASDGRPLVSVRLAVEVHASRNATRRWVMKVAEVVTDSDGRFQSFVTAHSEVERSLVLVVSPQDDVVLGRGSQRLAANLPTQSVTNIGDVTIDTWPVIAAGIVVDPNGVGVSNAIVFGQGERSDSNTTDLESQARSDVTGAFEIRGRPRSEALQLRARKGDIASGNVEVHAGDTHVRIELGNLCELSGTVLLPSGMSHAGWSVWAVAETGDWAPRTLDEQGRFTIPGLKPGPHAVYVGTHSKSYWSIVDDVVIVLGKNMPRELNPMDLRDLRRIDVTIIDPRGEPIDSARVRAQSLHQDEYLDCQAGQTTILTDKMLTLTAQAPGYLHCTMTNVFESRTMQLGQGPELHFVLAKEHLSYSPNLMLSVRLTQGGDSVGFDEYPTLTFDDEGVASCPAPFVGRVELHVAMHASAGWDSVDIDAAVARTLVVERELAEQTVELSLDSAAIATALKELDAGD